MTQPPATRRGDSPFSMIAAVARPGGEVTLETVTIDPPRSDEILVRTVATGICHTDITGLKGQLPASLPMVFGHEGSGVVEAVGADVVNIAPGDHVVMSYLSCGGCGECATGHQSSCQRAGLLCFSGARPDGSHALHSHDGSQLNDRFFGQSSFAQYSIANRNNVVKVPEHLPLAMLGPLGCGIMTGAGAAWNVLEVQPGMSFAVFGSGAVGLSALMAARLAGATAIIAVDRVRSRLDLARELGATHVIDAGREDVNAALRLIAPEGIDRTFDTTGRSSVMEDAVAVLAPRGVTAFAAHAAGNGLDLNIRDLVLGSKSVRGVAEGGRSAAENIGRILNHHAIGEFPFDRLIQYYPYGEINRAIADSLTGVVVKPVLLWD